MPIEKVRFIGTDVASVFFHFDDSGDILVTRGAELNQLFLFQQAPSEIEHTRTEFQGLAVTDIEPSIKAIFKFKNPASVDVLIEHLNLIKESLISNNSSGGS